MHTLAWTAVNRHGAQQRVHEFAGVLELVTAAHPAVIAEIGVGSGGSLYAWTALRADVYAITAPVPGPGCVISHGAAMLFADSHTAEARDWLALCVGRRPLDVLHIDGDHTPAGALRDLADYGAMVRDGGLILMHDVVNTRDCAGLAELWGTELQPLFPGAYVIAGGERPLGTGVITKRNGEWPWQDRHAANNSPESTPVRSAPGRAPTPAGSPSI